MCELCETRRFGWICALCQAIGCMNDCIHHHNWNRTNCRREAVYRIPNDILNMCTCTKYVWFHCINTMCDECLAAYDYDCYFSWIRNGLRHKTVNLHLRWDISRQFRPICLRDDDVLILSYIDYYTLIELVMQPT